MPISVYLVINGDETVNYPKNLLVQIGYGFKSDGSVRIPRQSIGVAALVDDMNLPNISSSAIEILKSKIGSCIFDFERSEHPVHAKIIRGLSDKRIIALPSRFYSYAPKALPIVNCQEPCNSWQQFASKMQQNFPHGWMLEITPWYHEKSGSVSAAEGYLPNALCYFIRQNDKVIYYDTRETIREKLKLSQQYGCKAAIALYREMTQLK